MKSHIDELEVLEWGKFPKQIDTKEEKELIVDGDSKDIGDEDSTEWEKPRSRKSTSHKLIKPVIRSWNVIADPLFMVCFFLSSPLFLF